jgi:hypothetical protein
MVMIFFEAAHALAGAETSVLPARQRLMDEFRRRARLPPGSADIGTAIVRTLQGAGVLRAVPNRNTRLEHGVTIGEMLQALRAPPPRARPRKQPSPRRCVLFVHFHRGAVRF